MKYDCIVCGAGTSGMCAAISARRNGLSVLLVEKTGVLGGTNVLSLVSPLMSYHYQCSTHKDIMTVNKGIAQEIVNRLQTNNQSLGHILDPLGFATTITPIDIEGLKQLYFDIVTEEKINVLFHTFIYDVIKDKDNSNKIIGLKVIGKDGQSEIYGDVIIDATGDGDVSVLSGCSFQMGRTSDNLCQPMTMLFTCGNVDLNKVRTYMKENPNDFVTRDDYNYEYIGVSGFFSKVNEAQINNEFDIPRDRVLFFQDVRRNEVTINMTRVQKLSGVNSQELSLAQIIGRNQIKKAFEFMVKYIPGFADSYIVRTPETIGVRETRHIIGDYIMSYDDLANERTFDDSIAMGAFPMDIHSPDTKNLEGTTNVVNVCYEIPMRVLLPKDVEGLITCGRCVSATHEASASMRLSPICMSLGEAAGVMASIAVKKNILIHDIEYKDVQDILTRQNQVYKKN